MEMLIKLILAHLLGDFLFQSSGWVKSKETKGLTSPFFYAHITIHFLLSWLILWQPDGWKIALPIALLHGLIDWLKIHFQRERTARAWFFADQILHLLTIAGVWLFFEQPAFSPANFFSREFFIVVTAVYVITSPTAVLIRFFALPWTKELDRENSSSSLANAGKYIGIFERLLIFCFVILGQWSGVGFLFAAKSVFRFGDLSNSSDRKLTEYILIGTLLSFGIAIGTGLLARFML